MQTPLRLPPAYLFQPLSASKFLSASPLNTLLILPSPNLSNSHEIHREVGNPPQSPIFPSPSPLTYRQINPQIHTINRLSAFLRIL